MEDGDQFIGHRKLLNSFHNLLSIPIFLFLSGGKHPLDKIGGSQGSMHAGSAGGIDKDRKAGSSSRNIEFQKGGK